MTAVPQYAHKYGLFYFDDPPWAQEPETNLIFGHTSWVKSAVPGSRFYDSQDVMVQWPRSPFRNYLKVARSGRSDDFFDHVLSATILVTSNSA